MSKLYDIHSLNLGFRTVLLSLHLGLHEWIDLAGLCIVHKYYSAKFLQNKHSDCSNIDTILEYQITWTQIL